MVYSQFLCLNEVMMIFYIVVCRGNNVVDILMNSYIGFNLVFIWDLQLFLSRVYANKKLV